MASLEIMKLSIKRPYKDEYDELKLLELNEEIVVNFLEKCKKVDLNTYDNLFAKSDVKKLIKLGLDQ